MFLQQKSVSQRNDNQTRTFETDDLIKYLSLMIKLEINDTQLFEKCIDLLYDRID